MMLGIDSSVERLQGAEPTLGQRNRAADFAWFDSLGLPDLSQAKFVRVATASWWRIGDAPAQKFYFHGFLLKADDSEFTVFGGDLQTRTFKKSPAGVEEIRRVGYEPVDPLTFVNGIDMRKFGSSKDLDGGDQRHRNRISAAAELAVLAWGCSKSGNDKAAAALHDLAMKSPSRRDTGDPKERFHDRIAGDLALAEMWDAVESFVDPTTPRQKLLAMFEHIIKHYPKSEQVERAKEHAVVLSTMIREDREHAERRKTGKPPAELTRDEQIAEWIFQLREQNAYQTSQPGFCDIFDDGRDEKNSPAHKLVEIGYDAVPQLIAVLDDQRFSRSVGYHRSHYFSHKVLRIGDCAHQILSVIAGRGFYGEYDGRGKVVFEGGEPTAKKMIAAWYTELQKKGEKGMLADAVAAGSRTSSQVAEKLVEKYPADALAPLIAGARAAKEDFVRRELVQLAGGLKGDGPIPFLLEELKSGSSLSIRIAAAEALQARGRPEALEAMLAEWRLTKHKSDDPLAEQRIAYLAPYLAAGESAKGLEALAERYDDCPIDTRIRIVEFLGRQEATPFSKQRPKVSAEPIDPLGPKASKELRAAALKWYLIALDDVSPRFGLTGSWNGKSLTDPRVCDLAGLFLEMRNPRRYPFDAEASAKRRNEQLTTLKQELRREVDAATAPARGR